MSAPVWPTVDVVIPALNEREGLPLVLGALPRHLVREVVVVDNGSVDGTAEAAQGLGATVVREPRRGYGSACLAGIARLSRLPIPPEVVVFLDADFSDHPEELPLLVNPIARGEADLVVGSRLLGSRERGALPAHSRLGNALAARLLRWWIGAAASDLGPFRAIRWAALLELGMSDRGYGWTVEMQIKAARCGLRAVEVPVSYRRRVGISKVSGTVRGSAGAGAKILLTIARYGLSRPTRRARS